ncbi:MAG: tRNA (adenosine(37)-N6)-threonylcarbamoyltransferase complex ATPase subunit type 1 TsaE [Clostridiales bacterium]|nr:tRNA (adenosine(37)-N6)-threonylcarbamoyltransferase complex ATPase subunit type 1 TsaE [Clostridiales bacterium]
MSKVFTTKNITRIALFSALSFVLYTFLGFKVPGFPPFFTFQVSEMPALLAGYMMGPVAGCIVILMKILLKLLVKGTGSAGSGELSDLLLGCAFVIVASLIYRRHRSKKGALVSLAISTVVFVAMSVLVNAFIVIPYYAAAMPGGLEAVAKMLSNLFPEINGDNFMSYYLPLSVVPFNLLRGLACCIITFLVYKRLERLFDLMFEPQQKYLIIGGKKCILKHMVTKSEQDTYNLGVKLGSKLVGGEVILLSGDLGAGKTVFARGIAQALGIQEGVVSPTFTLMNCYEGRLKMYHYDAYRLSGAEEAEERGLTEFFGAKDGVCVIEWPDKIAGAIPDGAISITIKYKDENTREVSVC